MCFLVTPERMIKLLSTHAKGKLQGQFNWYVNSKDGMVHAHYNYADTEYLCIMDKEGIPVEIRFYMGESSRVLGVYEEKDEEAAIFPSILGVNHFGDV